MEKIVFFGTPEFSAKILKDLTSHYEVVLVVTQPDKPSGRKAEIQESAVSMMARELSISTYKSSSLKKPEAEEKIKSAGADIFVVVAYGKIIPSNILEIAKRGAINIHGSVLPKYRGASPIHATLLNGEKSTGITIMLMDSEMDHGPILSARSIEIDSSDTFAELESKLCTLASDLVLETIPKYLSEKIKPKEQNHTEATFTKILTKEDGKIDWQKSATEIHNQYRAFKVWPGIWTTLEGKVLKIHTCRSAKDDSEMKPGQVFKKSEHVFVKCGQDALMLEEVQLEGKQKMSAADFLRGRPKFLDSELGR
jgi:methionyl-tRNA formyltransferase